MTSRRPPTKKNEQQPQTGDEVWVFDRAFIEEQARNVPSNPDDVDDACRSLFEVRLSGDQWFDSDEACFALGIALGIFRTDADFPDYKYIFWTDNVLGTKLLALLKALARKESRCVEVNDEFRFRRRVVGTPPI